MITDVTLADVRDTLYKCLETLYLDDKDDEFAKYLAGNIYLIYEQIELELLERMMSR